MDETGRRITLRLNRDPPWPGGKSRLSGYDVSRGLLAMADPADPAYRPDWAAILDAVAVRHVDEVEIDLLQSHLCPQAFLQTVLVPCTAARAPRAERGKGTVPFSSDENRDSPPVIPSSVLGPYALAVGGAADAQATYLWNARYFAGNATQPREIIQRRFPDAAAAVKALRRGEIQVLDRLSPWQVKALSADADVVVQAYGLPRVHCLVPNARRPLTSSRTFRRALAYGINRQAVLDEIVRGNRQPGCEVLHGPFPSVNSAENTLDYASDPATKPWPCDPRLAAALAEAGRREAAASGQGRTAVASPSPVLVLAFPPGEITRTACEVIRRQLAASDIAVQLKELSAVPSGPIPADVDLLYVELALWEPLVDAARVLGEDGLAGGCSSPMSRALGELQRAATWDEAVARLHRIDRIAHDEVALVPLWQLTDTFAYRKNLEGIKPGTLSLYQDVEQWKLGFEYPSGK